MCISVCVWRWVGVCVGVCVCMLRCSVEVQWRKETHTTEPKGICAVPVSHAPVVADCSTVDVVVVAVGTHQAWTEHSVNGQAVCGMVD